MPFFQNKSLRQDLQTQIDACRGDLDVLNTRLGEMRTCFEEDLGRLRKDFDELIAFLKESATESGPEAEAVRTPAAVGEPITVLRSDLAGLADQVDAIGQKTDDFNQALVQIHTMVGAGFDDLKKQVNDTRKDIANRISFAVSRLRA